MHERYILNMFSWHEAFGTSVFVDPLAYGLHSKYTPHYTNIYLGGASPHWSQLVRKPLPETCGSMDGSSPISDGPVLTDSQHGQSEKGHGPFKR